MVVWPCHSGPVVAQYIIIEEASVYHTEAKKQRERGKDQGHNVPFNDLTSFH
jgi:hypothetical protein